MNKKFLVYVHINKVNGKRYYGITSMKPKERWRRGDGYVKNDHFTNSINKYGWNGFDHIIIARDLTEDEAKWLEVQMIAAHNTNNPEFGYNITKGGEGTCGYHHTEKTKKKISKAKMGSVSPRKGVVLLEETKEKISENRKGKLTGKDHGKAKSIICITTKKIFFTVAEGVKTYNVPSSNICKCCKGKRKSAGECNGQKLVWKYLNWKHNKTYRIA